MDIVHVDEIIGFNIIYTKDTEKKNRFISLLTPKLYLSHFYNQSSLSQVIIKLSLLSSAWFYSFLTQQYYTKRQKLQPDFRNVNLKSLFYSYGILFTHSLQVFRALVITIDLTDILSHFDC